MCIPFTEEWSSSLWNGHHFPLATHLNYNGEDDDLWGEGGQKTD